MRKLHIIILLAITLGLSACATTPSNQAGAPDVDLTGLIDQLELFNKKSAEFKRNAIRMYLDGALIDIGAIGVLLKKSKHNIPSGILEEVLDSLKELKIAAQKLKDGIELTDLELGEAAGHAIYVHYQGLTYGIKALAPYVAKLLGL